MATSDTNTEANRLKLSAGAELEAALTAELKSRYGSGVYVQNVHTASSGDKVVSLGNTLPKDVSDCRHQDNTLKMVDVRNIATLHAEPTSGGYYVVELPDRDTVAKGFKDRKEEMAETLDIQMAQAIYNDVYDLGPVKTQLTPILQILRWTRNHEPLDVERVDREQPSENTMDYLNALDQLGYLEVVGGEIRSGRKLLSADLNEVSSEDFGRTILGDVVRSGYHTLRDELGLNMLSHYPKFAAGYYSTAVQRSDPDVWLDVDAVQRNLMFEYGEEHGELFIDAKLSELNEANVLEKDGSYVKGVEDVYEEIATSVALS